MFFYDDSPEILPKLSFYAFIFLPFFLLIIILIFFTFLL